ncbi:MAG: flagellar hook-associated protein 3, partial [Burkholderiaceae bacterium]
MRIATANAYDASLNVLMTRQSNLAESQQQLTTGKRVNRASDDPAAAARAERALAAEARGTANLR